MSENKIGVLPPLLISLGVIFLLDNMGIGSFAKWWPIILIIVGASKIIESVR